MCYAAIHCEVDNAIETAATFTKLDDVVLHDRPHVIAVLERAKPTDLRARIARAHRECIEPFEN